MKLIKKALNYYRRAYLNNHFPSIQDLFSKKDILVYYGFLGDRNYGDEWVYESTKYLFQNYTILPLQRWMPIHAILFYKLFGMRRVSGIILGGGTLVGSSFDMSDEFLSLRKSSNLPLFMHGTGVHPPETFHHLWKNFIGSDVYGGVRGPMSQLNLAPINSGMTLIGDAAFAMFDHNAVYSGNDSKVVLINLGTHKPYQGMEHFRNVLATFVRYLQEEGYSVKFLPLHNIDYELGLRFSRQFPGIEVLDIPRKFSDIKPMILNSYFMLGERLHFTVAGLTLGCPLLSINYEKKHVDLLASLEAVKIGLQPGDAAIDQIIQIFQNRNPSLTKSIMNNVEKFKTVQNDDLVRFTSAIKKNRIQ
jgi:polysaccharide pyruvyl transferase WcaK-like protein